MPQTRVLLVDDSAIMRSMVRRLFESQPDFEVSGEAENGQEAIEKAANLKPDLIILDLAMPVMTGLDAAPVLRKMLPATLLILFTVHEGREVAKLALAAGIHAVVPKTQAAATLITQAQVLLSKCKVVWNEGTNHAPMPYRVMVVDSEFQKVTIWPTKFPWRVNELQGITPVITDDQFGHIKELAKKVMEETDPDKYIELVMELNRLLDEVVPPPTHSKS